MKEVIPYYLRGFSRTFIALHMASFSRTFLPYTRQVGRDAIPYRDRRGTGLEPSLDNRVFPEVSSPLHRIVRPQWRLRSRPSIARLPMRQPGSSYRCRLGTPLGNPEPERPPQPAKRCTRNFDKSSFSSTPVPRPPSLAFWDSGRRLHIVFDAAT